MCSKYKDNRRYIPAYTFFNSLSLSKGRREVNPRGKILYREISYLLKKTQPAIPSYQLAIAGLEHKKHTYESSNNFYQNEESESTTPASREHRTPPPIRVSAVLQVFYITESLILAVVIAAFTVSFIGTQEVA